MAPREEPGADAGAGCQQPLEGRRSEECRRRRRGRHGGEGASRERGPRDGGGRVRGGAPSTQGHGGAPGDGDPVVLLRRRDVDGRRSGKPPGIHA